MKSKFFIIGIAIVIAIIVISLFCLERKNGNIDWIKELNYKKEEIHDMSIGLINPCPTIPVELDNKKINIEFDTGNTEGISITSAIKGKVDCEVTGKITSANADGTYRGNGESIVIKSVNIFGEKYTNVNSSLTDWRMYGSLKFNGLIGLKYFRNKVVTLDYKNKKIAVSNNSIDYNKLPKEKYTILPLVSPSASSMKDLLFFEGEVNGEKSTIYLDTGSSRSFVNLEGNNKDTSANVKLGDKKYKFQRLRNNEIGFTDKFNFPLRLAINSDLLKANHFVITIDRIQNNIIISQN